MSQPSLAFPPRHVPASKRSQEAGLDPHWIPWAERLEGLLNVACRRLNSRAQRVSRLSITLEGPDGRRYRRSLALPAAAESSTLRPAALGLLRLMLAEYPLREARIGLHFNGLMERHEAPIRFKAYLDRKKKARRLEGLRRWLPFFKSKNRSDRHPPSGAAR